VTKGWIHPGVRPRNLIEKLRKKIPVLVAKIFGGM
jgi:hypothetical protein